jgi:hypothetical protein
MCSVIVSGAVTGTSVCTADAVYGSLSRDITIVQLSGFTPIGEFQFGYLAFSLPGRPAVGSFDDSSPGVTTTWEIASQGRTTWIETTGSASGTYGSASMTLTSVAELGPMSDGTHYAVAGTMHLSLVDVQNQSNPGVVADVTF